MNLAFADGVHPCLETWRFRLRPHPLYVSELRQNCHRCLSRGQWEMWNEFFPQIAPPNVSGECARDGNVDGAINEVFFRFTYQQKAVCAYDGFKVASRRQ